MCTGARACQRIARVPECGGGQAFAKHPNSPELHAKHNLRLQSGVTGRSSISYWATC
jgi:hypothetical protein